MSSIVHSQQRETMRLQDIAGNVLVDHPHGTLATVELGLILPLHGLNPGLAAQKVANVTVGTVVHVDAHTSLKDIRHHVLLRVEPVASQLLMDASGTHLPFLVHTDRRLDVGTVEVVGATGEVVTEWKVRSTGLRHVVLVDRTRKTTNIGENAIAKEAATFASLERCLTAGVHLLSMLKSLIIDNTTAQSKRSIASVLMDRISHTVTDRHTLEVEKGRTAGCVNDLVRNRRSIVATIAFRNDMKLASLELGEKLKPALQEGVQLIGHELFAVNIAAHLGSAEPGTSRLVYPDHVGVAVPSVLVAVDLVVVVSIKVVGTVLIKVRGQTGAARSTGQPHHQWIGARLAQRLTEPVEEIHTKSLIYCDIASVLRTRESSDDRKTIESGFGVLSLRESNKETKGHQGHTKSGAETHHSLAKLVTNLLGVCA
mmetsp:Transcript_1300/g.4014  ORF Transcript_1300/g.4014 Transcript_1300/m.4014 type:complete len:427 (+) Transcript_1300:324-1604(+)